MLGGKILRLWQLLAIATIYLAGILVIPTFKPQEYQGPKQQQYTGQTTIFNQREVISRESRKPYEVEIYYGKPGVFNLQEMLQMHSVTIYPEDIVKVFPDPAFGLGSKITIYRAMPILVNDAGDKKVYRTWAKTIKEFLEEQNIELGEEDKVKPTIETSLNKNLEVYITRVSETTVTESVALDFKTLKREDPNLERGRTKVVSVGKKGQKARVYKVRRENGKEVSRRLIEEKIVIPPQDEVIVYGTKKAITVSCRYNNLVLEAANKYNVEPNALCTLMMRESNGNPNSVGFWGESTYGLFQYKMGFWKLVSAQAGFAGASWQDPRAQIFSTAWAFANGYRNRWP